MIYLNPLYPVITLFLGSVVLSCQSILFELIENNSKESIEEIIKDRNKRVLFSMLIEFSS